jgi:hypothetical protein
MRIALHADRTQRPATAESLATELRRLLPL